MGYSPQTRQLFMRACGDCHSNETKWPLYSNIAPLSWGIAHHVEEGREALNISEWDETDHKHARKAPEELREGEMPLSSYLLAHSEAKLSHEEQQLLINGLVKTFGDE